MIRFDRKISYNVHLYGEQEIFQLTVAAFQHLSNVSSRCHAKAVSMLDTISKVRSCLMMLDLECDALVVEMFQHFLKVIG